MIHRHILFTLAVIGSLCHTAQAQIDYDSIEINTTDLGNGIYMLDGWDLNGNLGLSVGEDGVFLIDDSFAPLSEKILAAIGEITDRPVDFLVNTHWHGDHTGGNEPMAKAGAVIVAHDNVRVRMAAEGPRQAPEGALPVITFSDTTTFHMNGHEIHVFHPARAHTDGDAVIHFRDLDIIHAGDLLFNGKYPFIDVASGGSVDGYLEAMEQLVAMSGPETRFIAGHGPLASRNDVQTAIDMLRTAVARFDKLIAEGKSLEEVKALDPMADYHETWAWAFITAEVMTEQMYNALKAKSVAYRNRN